MADRLDVGGRIEDAIFVSLAGPYAQRRFDPNSDWNDDREYSDLDEVSELIAELHQGGSEVATAFRHYMEALTWKFIDDLWPAIEAVARRLIEQRTITGDEMKEAGGAALKVELDAMAASLGLDARS